METAQDHLCLSKDGGLKVDLPHAEFKSDCILRSCILLFTICTLENVQTKVIVLLPLHVAVCKIIT